MISCMLAKLFIKLEADFLIVYLIVLGYSYILMPVLFLVDPSMYCVMVHPWIISDQVSDLVLHQRTFSREKQCWDWVFFIEIILSAFLKSWLWFKNFFGSFRTLQNLFRISSKSPESSTKSPESSKALREELFKSFLHVCCFNGRTRGPFWNGL